MPAHSLVVEVRQDTPYRRLATNDGEKCELVSGDQVYRQQVNWLFNIEKSGYDNTLVFCLVIFEVLNERPGSY